MAEDVESDLFDFVAPTKSALQNISVFASRALELNAQIEQAEAFLKSLKDELQLIEEGNLPSVMQECGLIEFKMQDGSKITIRPAFQGGIVKEDLDKRRLQLDWVAESGGESLIKETFNIVFNKGESERAQEVKKLLELNSVPYKESETVHAALLGAFVKEKIANGEVVPLDELGWRYFQKATVKKAK